MAYQTREEWLQRAVQLIARDIFEDKGYTMPDRLAISVGFPKGGGRGCKAIGQCWDPKVTHDGTTHIFICPTLGDAMRVLDVVVHEVIHAMVGLKCGHRGAFKKLATEVGLEGKMTATVVTPGSDLHRKLASIYTALGPYPHSQMNPREPISEGPGEGDGEGGKGGVKWPFYISRKEPSYKVQIRPKLLELYGPPKDPWGEDMVDRDAPPVEDDE